MPDVVLNVLVALLWHFPHLLNHTSKNEHLQSLATFLPKTYNGLLQLVELDSERHFTSYVVRPRFSSAYNYESCYEVMNGKIISKSCQFVAFPDHLHRSQRECCGMILLRKVRTKSKGIDLVPLKTYVYQSLREAITFMVSKPGFLDLCEHWRVRASKFQMILLQIPWNQMFFALLTALFAAPLASLLMNLVRSSCFPDANHLPAVRTDISSALNWSGSSSCN